MWGPRLRNYYVGLHCNSHFTMVYDTYNYSIHGVYKPTNQRSHHRGAPHPRWFHHENPHGKIPPLSEG